MRAISVVDDRHMSVVVRHRWRYVYSIVVTTLLTTTTTMLRLLEPIVPSNSKIQNDLNDNNSQLIYSCTCVDVCNISPKVNNESTTVLNTGESGGKTSAITTGFEEKIDVSLNITKNATFFFCVFVLLPIIHKTKHELQSNPLQNKNCVNEATIEKKQSTSLRASTHCSTATTNVSIAAPNDRPQSCI
jgi:hypothetical protein